LNSDYAEEEDDIWFQKDRLFKDHIQEVLNKWKQIDDEIWAKIIVMERNRRVAKAYARAPVLTINGSDDGFDGYRIGLCGFDNPMRDAKTEEIKKHIGHGVKIKMDDGGNIMIKRVSRSNVYVKEVRTEENSITNEIIMAGGLLEIDKPVKIFDMKKFAANVDRELRRVYPDRRNLESQCISAINFVKDSPELLDCSCWVMIINIVALDMLKSKLPLVSKRSSIEKVDRRKHSHEENPYTVLPSSSDSTNFKTFDTCRDSRPPKLPPRDMERVPVPKPDYDDWKNRHPVQRHQQSGYKDDPYYCGMKARVPNFVKKHTQNHQMVDQVLPVRKSHSSGYLSFLRQNEKSVDPRRGNNFVDEECTRTYGKIKSANTEPQGMFVGEWE